jgi:iron(III) transport system ATP-binding protein
MGASCRIEGLVKNYGKRRIVDGISLDVRAGEFLVILGPSGCGKTTTLRMIAGLERPDSGTISIDERVMSDTQRGIFVPPEDRDLGMVFQSYAIWPHMTVGENIAFPLRARSRVPRADIARKVREALARIGMEGYEDRPASALSGGQMQRVVLARAIVYDPRILLFDEPLSNLDLKMREHLRLELKDLQASTGLTSVYVTHDQTEAVELADRIAVVDGGRIVQLGTPTEIYRRPSTRFVAEFISSANIFRATVAAMDNAGHARVTTLAGRTLVARTERALAPGTDVDVVIHPEECDLNTGQPGTAVKVRQARFQGVSIRYTLDWSGADFDVVVLGTAHAFSPGDEVTLVIDPDAARILPGAET